MRAQLAKSPYDLQLNLDLARLLEDEGKFDELNDRLRIAAGLTNWSHDAMAEVIQYYVDKVHNPDAAIAFLEARAKIEPHAGQLIYSVAALHASLNHKDEAIKYLTQAAAGLAARMPSSRRASIRAFKLHDDPRFQAHSRRHSMTRDQFPHLPTDLSSACDQQTATAKSPQKSVPAKNKKKPRTLSHPGLFW